MNINQLKDKIEAKQKDFASMYERRETFTPADVDTFKALHAEITDLKSQYAELKSIEDSYAQSATPIVQPEHKSATNVLPFSTQTTTVDLRAELANAANHFKSGNRTDFTLSTTLESKAVFDTGTGLTPARLRDNLVVDSLRRPLSLLSVIPTGNRNVALTEYVRETAYTNVAAETAEGGQKPEGTFAFTVAQSTPQVIAVTLPVTEQMIEDVDGIESTINNRLIRSVQERLEGQVLSGNGTAPNLRGILNTSGIGTRAKSTDTTIEAIYGAIIQTQVNAFVNPSMILLHPTVWQSIRLAKDTTNNYLFGAPGIAGANQLWGLPVYTSVLMPTTSALIGAPDTNCQITTINGGRVRLAVGYVNDDFRRNQLTLRAELRVAFDVYRPTAFTQVTGL